MEIPLGKEQLNTSWIDSLAYSHFALNTFLTAIRYPNSAVDIIELMLQASINTRKTRYALDATILALGHNHFETIQLNPRFLDANIASIASHLTQSIEFGQERMLNENVLLVGREYKLLPPYISYQPNAFDTTIPVDQTFTFSLRRLVSMFENNHYIRTERVEFGEANFVLNGLPTFLKNLKFALNEIILLNTSFTEKKQIIANLAMPGNIFHTLMHAGSTDGLNTLMDLHEGLERYLPELIYFEGTDMKFNLQNRQVSEILDFHRSERQVLEDLTMPANRRLREPLPRMCPAGNVGILNAYMQTLAYKLPRNLLMRSSY